MNLNASCSGTSADIYGPPTGLSCGRPGRALTRISKSALYLQQPLRRHVLLATRTLAEADQLVEGRWVSDSPRMIGVVVIRRVRELVACYLRNERVPPELSDRFEQYQIGLNNLDEYIEHQLESQIESGPDSGRG